MRGASYGVFVDTDIWRKKSRGEIKSLSVGFAGNHKGSKVAFL